MGSAQVESDVLRQRRYCEQLRLINRSLSNSSLAVLPNLTVTDKGNSREQECPRQ